VFDGHIGEAEERFVNAVLQPLWDLKLTIGQHVRELTDFDTVDEQNPEFLLALCDLRLLTGHVAVFDNLLARRATCRNFDAEKPLPYALFAQLMERVFSAQSHVRVSDDTVFLKKTSPSGGGLHPIEAYLIVQNVEGVAPGLYHYHPIAHALEPLPAPERPLQELAMAAVAGQHWFANAHVMVLMAPRYDRSFWKYRNHAKAYRAITLEAGHLSQTLYLCATEAGLAAYITCAINEVPLEQAFALDPLSSGALAICGFGWRGEEMVTLELDPAGEVWRTEDSLW
jgi:putative peptide maturation dehydrogenase